MSKKDIPKSVILEATIALIEQVGIENVTVRGIAEMADVNVAAINYHFGSKDQLIELALDRTIDELIKDMGAAVDEIAENPEKGLREFLFWMMEGSIRYPKITAWHLYEALYNKNGTSRFVIEFNCLLSRMAAKLSGDKDVQGVVELMLLEIFSTLFVLGLSPAFYKSFNGIDLSSPEDRVKLSEMFLKQFKAKHIF